MAQGSRLAAQGTVRAFRLEPWAFGLVLLAACSPSSGGGSRDDILRVIVAAPPTSLDPRLGTDRGSQRVHQLVYDQLLTIDDQLRVVAGPPALATRLENPDPLTYIVHIRAGVRFHDGHELTSRDVVYTFASFLDPAFVSPRKAAYGHMAAVRALDDYRVEFKLKEPFGAFPLRLVTQVVPADSGESLLTFPIGTGPYRFVRYIVDAQVEFSAFEGYWDGLPLNAGVTLRIIPDDTTRARELRNGSADLIDGLRLSPRASFGTLKDVRKRQAYGGALSGPSDRP